MIFDKYELESEIEKLRLNTFPSLWQEVFREPSTSHLKDLEEILIFIKTSKDPHLHKKATQIIESHVDIDVDCNPSTTVQI